jgi:hypothetical protein
MIFDVLTRRYRGFQPAQTAAAVMISCSKDVINSYLDVLRLKKQLEKQIKDYTERVRSFERMKTPEPGARKKREKEKSEYYHIKRRVLLAVIHLMEQTAANFSKELIKALKDLRRINLASQRVLFILDKRLNRFLDFYHKEYKRRARSRQPVAGLKEFADKIVTLKGELKSELRKIWEASKTQERGVLTHYSIEEWSLQGSVRILKLTKQKAIEVGTIVQMMKGILPTNIERVAENSKTLIENNVLIQKNVKTLVKRFNDKLSEAMIDISKIKGSAHLLRILNRAQREYRRVTKEFTEQSRRLWMDIRYMNVKIEPVASMPVKTKPAV